MSKRTPLPIFERFILEDVADVEAEVRTVQDSITDLRDKIAKEKEATDIKMKKMNQDLEKQILIRDETKLELQDEREKAKIERDKQKAEKAKEKEEEEKSVNETVDKENGNWVVKSKAGKTLGTHKTEGEAKKQLAAIEISKHNK